MNYFDLHCDTLGLCSGRGHDFLSKEHHVVLEANPFDLWVQCFAVFVIDTMRGDAGFEYVEKAYRYLCDFEEKHPELLHRCLTSADFEVCEREHTCAAVLTLEGGSGIGDKIENVRKLSDMGVKMITLTWSGSTALGDGVMVENPRGLTDFGREVLLEMEKYGIVIDISHASERLFWDVAEETPRPLVASHSNSKELCSHPRNLTDEQFAEIRRRGGLVGLNYYDAFLDNDPEKASIERIVDHAEHFLSLGGEDILALGSDFDGSKMPRDIRGIESVPKIAEAFLRRNYKESLVRKILFENAADFFKKVM